MVLEMHWLQDDKAHPTLLQFYDKDYTITNKIIFNDPRKDFGIAMSF